MNIDAINLLCEKLGTTVESLVPTVNEYLIHSANIGIVIGAAVFVVGLILVFIGFVVNRTDDGFFFWLAGGFLLAVGVIAIGINVYCKHIYTAYPTISAYKEILSWIGRQ